MKGGAAFTSPVQLSLADGVERWWFKSITRDQITAAVGSYAVTITAVKAGYALESIQTTSVDVTVIDLDDIAPNRPTDLAAS